MSSNTNRTLERRKGPDFWVKSIPYISIAGWLILITITIILGEAKPQTEYLLDRLNKISVRRTWDSDLAQYALYLLYFLLTFSTLGFIVNFRRCRRKTDKYSWSIIMMIAFSFVGLILYLIYL